MRRNLIKRAAMIAVIAVAMLASPPLMAGTAMAADGQWRFHSQQRTAIGCDQTGRAYVNQHSGAHRWLCQRALNTQGQVVWLLFIYYR
ncbi:hypothetical protein HNR23_002133 [Nocardiopsis mwathae]|uniref:Uncharacterized protein n=1 Tax=Nocardiopsis mwathae TaxID=1472723 RepID=A0A7W9YH59_9ACTN|nr:hypothetical protein [Nocardiopsis mwathae]MBB6172073.1 hypothetical protein [Nocardiopsis mwathae]